MPRRPATGVHDPHNGASNQACDGSTDDPNQLLTGLTARSNPPTDACTNNRTNQRAKPTGQWCSFVHSRCSIDPGRSSVDGIRCNWNAIACLSRPPALRAITRWPHRPEDVRQRFPPVGRRGFLHTRRVRRAARHWDKQQNKTRCAVAAHRAMNT